MDVHSRRVGKGERNLQLEIGMVTFEERKTADTNHRSMKRKIAKERELCKFYAKFFGFIVETESPNNFHVKMEHAGLYFRFKLTVLEDTSIDYAYVETNSQAQAPEYMYQEVNFDAS